MAAFHYDPESHYPLQERIPRKTDRVRRNKPPKSKSDDPKVNILVPRRQLSGPDKKRIGTIVQAALSELSPHDSVKLTEIERKGFALATSSEIRNLYRANYFQSGIKAPRNFTGGLLRLTENMGNTNPLVFAKLGNISVYGDSGDNRSRKNFVGMDLVEPDSDVLADERERLIASLMPPNAGEDFRNALLAKRPHISLAKTHDKKAAQSLADRLRDTELTGAWVTLGQMEIVPLEIRIPSRSRSS